MTSEDALDTVTHAAVRARQGDVAGARRILARILRARPDDVEARTLLARIAGERHVPSTRSGEDREPAPTAARADELAERFRTVLGSAQSARRARRLRSILARIEAMRAASLKRTGEGP